VDQQGKKVHGKGTISLDAGKSPKEVDTKFSEGPIAGKTSLGIYELDGDTLKSCVAEPGDPRPKTFASRRGTRLMLVVYKRAQP